MERSKGRLNSCKGVECDYHTGEHTKRHENLQRKKTILGCIRSGGNMLVSSE
jgi:hypothetical protein